jgi:hypothetical protein
MGILDMKKCRTKNCNIQKLVGLNSKMKVVKKRASEIKNSLEDIQSEEQRKNTRKQCIEPHRIVELYQM